MEHDGAAAIRKGTRVTDPGLNAAFQQGAGMETPEPGTWEFVLELWWEGVKLRAKVYGKDAMPSLMRDMSEHLEQGPGAEATVSVTTYPEGLQHALNGRTQKPLSHRKDDDIVDAELVSDD